MKMKEKPSSGIKQFLLTLLATTFSIILTFGTSAIIDRRHKAAAKKEMVMMKTNKYYYTPDVTFCHPDLL